MQRSLFPFDNSTYGMNLVNSSVDERGSVYTRREVVEFILDLAGYTVSYPLYEFRLLEPSFGNGDFLFSVIERLLSVYADRFHSFLRIVEDLSHVIRGVELHHATFVQTRAKLLRLFADREVSFSDANQLLDNWLVEGDFLLIELPHLFTHIVGNPPYVRQELIPDALMAEYRARYRTIYDRADLYIPFIERSLSELEPGGTLGFICSDRWMKNKYGGPLRSLISKNYNLSCYVDMVDTPAFQSEVTAYPAITIIKREKQGPTRIIHRPELDSENLKSLVTSLNVATVEDGGTVIETRGIVKGNEPWILHSFDQLAIVRRLEKEFPLLEDAGCEVGIGVATGADKIYIGPCTSLDVEPDRILPLVTTKDIVSGVVDWHGLGIINPFNEDGTLVNLSTYPRLARYLNEHADAIRKRNCVKNNAKGWYRTIDRIYPALTYQPKLLIPDIKGEANIVYEEGRLYPHHNLYFITSKEWNLIALQAVLMSGIARLFVSTYSTKMRGGYLRFQAQYLRRIRLPKWNDVPDDTKTALIEAAKVGDVGACNRATYHLYRMTSEEKAAMGGNRNQEKRWD